MNDGINHRKSDTSLDRLGTLQGRLTYLFEHVRPFGRKPYSLREASDGIREWQKDEHRKACEEARKNGKPEPPFEPVKVTASYLHYLRTGDRVNPGVQQLTVIAGFFGVKPSFLLGEADVVARVADELAQLRTVVEVKEVLGDPNVAALAVKARGLSPELLTFVMGVLDKARTLDNQEPGREGQE